MNEALLALESLAASRTYRMPVPCEPSSLINLAIEILDDASKFPTSATISQNANGIKVALNTGPIISCSEAELKSSLNLLKSALPTLAEKLEEVVNQIENLGGTVTGTVTISLEQISSPNYPQDYPADSRIEYLLTAPAGDTITITFTDFDLGDPYILSNDYLLYDYHAYDNCLFAAVDIDNHNCDYNDYYDYQYYYYDSPGYHCWDWIEIIDGDGTILLEKSCEEPDPVTITSNSNVAKLRFKSDGSDQARGFEAQLSAGVQVTISPDPNDQRIKTDQEPGSDCKCGIEGEEATNIKYPWMAAIVDSQGAQICGGTLVASKYVISAAHCMFDLDEVALTTSDFKVGK